MKRQMTIFAMLAMTPASPAISAPTAPAQLPTGMCINAGNHLETGGDSKWGGKKLEASDFRIIKSAGFETVRIPVNWFKHIDKTASNRIDPDWLVLVEKRVDEALESGLNVILNSHHFEEVYTHPAEGGKILADVWGQIAARLANRPKDRLWFEIENEPHRNLNNGNLIEALGPSLARIRLTNPDRPVIIGGEGYSSVDSLATLELPDDPNLYPTFHYYEPFDFTHQGAGWAGDPPPPLGRVYGEPADVVRLQDDVEKVRRFIARTGKVPFLGENGAYDIIPLEQRVAYHRAVADAFAPVGIRPCVWAYTNTFSFYDSQSGKWNRGMKEAIGLKD